MTSLLNLLERLSGNKLRDEEGGTSSKLRVYFLNSPILECCQVRDARWQDNLWQVCCHDGSKHQFNRI